MEVVAKLPGAYISAQKARLVTDQIRGKKAGETLNPLAFSSKKAAEIMKKVPESTVANVEHNEGADVDDLKVSTVFVSEGRSLKRIMPCAKDRADRIAKRPCHTTVKVVDKQRSRQMGQKVHPSGIRPGIVKEHTSVWYVDRKNYADYLFADLKVRKYLQDRLKSVSVGCIDIHHPARTACITTHTARLDIVIDKKGGDAEKLCQDLIRQMGVPVHINIEEIRKSELDAMLVAQSVAQQLGRRVMFRRAMKRVAQSAMRISAKGIKIQVSGRLGEAGITRTEWYRKGRVSLRTLRADIDCTTYEVYTTYGVISVKVWTFKGEVIGGHQEELKSVVPAPRKKAVR